VSHMPRVARLAARVSEARRPKRLRAAPRPAGSPLEQRASAQRVSSEPAADVALARAHPGPPAPALPISDEAVRWLTRGAVPAHLVPLLGDPEFPAADTQATQAPTLPAAAAPPTEPMLAPARELAISPDAAGREALGEHIEQDKGPGRVLTRVIEGARDPEPPARPRARREPEDDRAIGPRGQSAWESPLTTIEEISRPAHDGQPLLRLARAPARSPVAPRTDAVAAPAATAAAELTPTAELATVGADRARELARQTSAELSSDGPGRSTVTFPAGASLGSSIVGASADGRAASASRNARPTSEHADASPTSESRDVGCPTETPLAGAVGERIGDLDLDAIYDGFLYRLRRDLLHDRERLGDLLGPIR
jgi:hypothetical protein